MHGPHQLRQISSHQALCIRQGNQLQRYMGPQTPLFQRELLPFSVHKGSIYAEAPWSRQLSSAPQPPLARESNGVGRPYMPCQGRRERRHRGGQSSPVVRSITASGLESHTPPALRAPPGGCVGLRPAWHSVTRATAAPAETCVLCHHPTTLFLRRGLPG